MRFQGIISGFKLIFSRASDENRHQGILASIFLSFVLVSCGGHKSFDSADPTGPITKRKKGSEVQEGRFTGRDDVNGYSYTAFSNDDQIEQMKLAFQSDVKFDDLSANAARGATKPATSEKPVSSEKSIADTFTTFDVVGFRYKKIDDSVTWVIQLQTETSGVLGMTFTGKIVGGRVRAIDQKTQFMSQFVDCLSGDCDKKAVQLYKGSPGAPIAVASILTRNSKGIMKIKRSIGVQAALDKLDPTTRQKLDSENIEVNIQSVESYPGFSSFRLRTDVMSVYGRLVANEGDLIPLTVQESIARYGKMFLAGNDGEGNVLLLFELKDGGKIWFEVTTNDEIKSADFESAAPEGQVSTSDMEMHELVSQIMPDLGRKEVVHMAEAHWRNGGHQQLRSLLRANDLNHRNGLDAFRAEVEANCKTDKQNETSYCKDGKLTIQYAPNLTKALDTIEKRKMPLMIVFKSLVESGFTRNAQSTKSALGWWQFMPATAETFGLKTSPTDQRLELIPSTIAAMKYLWFLLTKQPWGNDFKFAMAAYNTGEGNARRQFRKIDMSEISDLNEGFWYAYRFGSFPTETKNHVTRILSAVRIAFFPQEYGLDVTPFPMN
ncbi:MAG: transglycosylase SLT domain-containing protein [Bdellovibrionales bacterium]|nr:transglycosylase SLT domain-containing protein [Bdellovibrionales bacterium]